MSPSRRYLARSIAACLVIALAMGMGVGGVLGHDHDRRYGADGHEPPECVAGHAPDGKPAPGHETHIVLAWYEDPSCLACTHGSRQRALVERGGSAKIARDHGRQIFAAPIASSHVDRGKLPASRAPPRV